jgi:hypothetical protein
MYIWCDTGGRLIVRVYVDDLIITGVDIDMVGKFKAEMQSVFKMSDLGPLIYYLGIEVHQSRQGITISQGAYAEQILEKARLTDYNPSQTLMKTRHT